MNDINAKNKQTEYLRLLQERNRLKKQMTAKTKEQLAKEELERGFNTHFRAVQQASPNVTVTNLASVTVPPHNLTISKDSNVIVDNELEVIDQKSGKCGKVTKGWGSKSSVVSAVRSQWNKGVANCETSVPINHIAKTSSSNTNGEGVDDDLIDKNTINASDTNDEYDSDFDEQEIQEVEQDKAAVVAEDIDMDQSLVRRISSLGQHQKMRLLSLLQQDLTSSRPSQSDLNPSKVDDNPSTSTINRLAVPLSVISSSTPSSLSTALQSAPPPLLLGQVWGISMVKLRLLSSWGGKQVSLRAVRLRLQGKEGHTLDLLPLCGSRVLSGLLPLAASSEACRQLPALTDCQQLSVAARPSKAVSGDLLRRVASPKDGSVWRASFHSATSLELLFELPPAAALHAACRAVGYGEEMPELFGSLQLWLWNEEVASGTASSGAKDVDVYSDGRCVWTGELQPGGECPGGSVELPPSAVIPLVPPGKDSSGVHLAASVANAQPIYSVQQAPVATAVITESSVATTPDAPAALGVGEAANRRQEGAGEQRQATKGRRRSSDPPLDAPLSARRLIELDGKSRPRRGRREPPPGLSAVAEDDDSLLEESFSQSTDLLLSEQRSERERRIRQSLEAIQRVERYNLGRLRSSGGSFTDYSDSLEQMAGPFISKDAKVDLAYQRGSPKDCADDSLDHTAYSAGSMDAVASIVDGPSNDVDTSLLSSGTIIEAQQTVQFSKPSRVEVAPQYNQQKQRSQRIDEVQQTIQNTIADLAGIMSSLSIADRQRSKSLTAEVLPTGSVFRIEILSTWGDANYVGLNGLELFDQLGRLCVLASRQNDERFSRCIASVHSFPSDINCLSMFGGPPDPRFVTNLLDGRNFTRSDLHVWLAPHRTALAASDILEEGNSDTLLDNRNKKDMLFLESNSEALSIIRGRGLPVAPDVIAVVVLQFTEPTTLCMARLFNYNKSRTHNQRGVKHCRIYLDEKNIFTGELRMATGQLLSLDAESECIEFCAGHAPVILAARRLSDNLNCKALEEEEDVLEESVLTLMAFNRPRTSQSQPSQPNETQHSRDTKPVSSAALHARFVNAPKVIASPVDDVTFFESKNERINVQPQQLNNKSSVELFKAGVIRLDLMSTWGDKSYVGLCGIELLGLAADGSPQVVEIPNLRIEAYPQDMSAIGCFDDPRLHTNLLSGINNTTLDKYMWLIPFTDGGSHYLQLDCGAYAASVVGLRIWNYNKATSEDVLRGCRNLQVSFNGRVHFRCLLRMGPGCPGIHFPQTLLFRDFIPSSNSRNSSVPQLATSGRGYVSPAVRQDYETPSHVCGLLWRFTFFDNWNDGYYIGLDRIEFLDLNGEIIDVLGMGAVVDAVPYSLGDVFTTDSHQDSCQQQSSIMAQDPRTPLQLFTPLIHDNQPRSWLCPLSHCMTTAERQALVARNMQKKDEVSLSQLPSDNTLFILFNLPVSVSCIRLYNYSKTPARGVRSFSITVDGLIVYMGSLLSAEMEKQHTHTTKKASASGPKGLSRGQAVLFSNDARIVAANKDVISHSGSSEQDVLCINERQVMVRSKNMYNELPPNPSLEGVLCDFSKRPLTGFINS